MMKHAALFVGGFLFGTAGVSILSSKDAQTVYTHCTAAVLRGKDSVMKRFDVIRESCGDIKADADAINEARYARARADELERARALVAQAEAEKEGV